MAKSPISSKSPFRSDCLAGRVALLTGGGSGIGFEIARQLLHHGCAAVVLCGRRAAFLQKACAILAAEKGGLPNRRVLYQVCDVRKPEDCQAAVSYCRQQCGRLDILVNGAAGNFLAAAADLKPKGFATVLAIDTLGTFNMSNAAFPLLKQSASSTTGGATSIVMNISAMLQCPATFWQAHASAAKAAVDSLTRSLALEWGPDGIRVVGIAPGPIANTPGTTKLAPGLAQADMEGLIAEGIPLGRLGQAWEIGQAAVYLSLAAYVTGDVLVVDGGQWLYKPPLVPKEMVAELSRQVEATSRAQAPKRSKL
jgi:peroxisomal 2,4-dienoyl-CoA reductase